MESRVREEHQSETANTHGSFEGYYDAARGEAYAFCSATGECAYGVGADGDVLGVDYRSVLWLPADGSFAQSRTRRRRVGEEEEASGRALLEPTRAAVIL